jgi:hypothetical protein
MGDKIVSMGRSLNYDLRAALPRLVPKAIAWAVQTADEI